MPRTPTLRLIYLGVDITSSIKEFITAATLTDNLEGKADDLAITIDNRDLRWMDTWLPGEGDRIDFQIGYAGPPEDLTPSIQFEVDEPEWTGLPDMLRLGGVAVPVTASLKERRSVAYENTTLGAITQQVADRHGLELVGDIPSITFKRVSQKEQTDLSFLRKLAADYGVAFKVESSSRLVFFRLESLETNSPTLAIARSPNPEADALALATPSQKLLYASDYRIKRKAAGIYKAARVSYQDPEKGEFIDITIDLDGAEVPKPKDGEEGAIASESILRIRERVEDVSKARARAAEALKRANRARVSLSFNLEGEPLLGAGITVQLTGFKRLNGKYLLEKVTHRLTRSQGYRCSIEGYKVEA